MKSQGKSLLFVGAFPGPAGIDRYVSGDLALRLEALGWRVLITSRKPGRLARLLDHVACVWRRRNHYALACVDVFSGPAFLWAEAACRILQSLQKPYVLILRGGSLPEFCRRHPERARRLLNSAAAVACPSQYLLMALEGLRTEPVLIPNPLDLARYNFRERRSTLKHLVWLRAFHHIYNPEMAVEVLARVREQYPTTHLTMIGPDKGDGSWQTTKRAVARLGLEEAVNFPGPVAKQDVPSQLEQGDIFLNTTNFDNTPVSVLEALACGLPVVSTNVGGIPYLLEDGQTALLMRPGDADSMARAVVRLIQESELAVRLARNGRKLVEPFDWSVILPRWEQLLVGLLPRALPAEPSETRVDTPFRATVSIPKIPEIRGE
jgi:glycosyltransferase involved in cell wall biosynthesis